MPDSRMNVFLGTYTAAQRIDQLITNALVAGGVWTPWFAILSMIRIREPITPTELAAAMGLAPTTCSDRVQELVDNGNVERVPNPADGRSHLLRTTAAGREALDRGDAATLEARFLVKRHLAGSLEDIEAAIAELTRALEAALDEQRRAART
jgi:DNA-binding MarR family transcriptional regulator